jgi:hypothetical protein
MWTMMPPQRNWLDLCISMNINVHLIISISYFPILNREFPALNGIQFSHMPRREMVLLKKTISLIIQPTWLPWRWLYLLIIFSFLYLLQLKN